MRHVILTCENHPELRWSTKEIAVTNGKYNGCRNIFFNGIPSGKGMFFDGSGLNCTELKDGQIVRECSCPSSCLIIAPEDKDVKIQIQDENGNWIHVSQDDPRLQKEKPPMSFYDSMLSLGY